MGKKLTDEVYLVLSGERSRYYPDEVRSMTVVASRKTKPALKSGQVAVKVVLSIDATLFEQFIPEIEVEIEGHDIIVPTVEIIDQHSDTE